MKTIFISLLSIFDLLFLLKLQRKRLYDNVYRQLRLSVKYLLLLSKSF